MNTVGIAFLQASKVKRCGEECDDGCGCKQPTKIKKEGLATIIGEWDKIEGLGESEDKSGSSEGEQDNKKENGYAIHS